eukprot:scaffold31830_cov129-Isochrysis_galbana.AAC.5
MHRELRDQCWMGTCARQPGKSAGYCQMLRADACRAGSTPFVMASISDFQPEAEGASSGASGSSVTGGGSAAFRRLMRKLMPAPTGSPPLLPCRVRLLLASRITCSVQE